MEEFSVAVIALGGERHVIGACVATSTVLDLKMRTAKAFEVRGRLELMLGTTLLQDTATLEDSGIREGAELSMTRSLPVVVIDNGSEILKAGFAGEDVPTVLLPCIVGEPKPGAELPMTDQKIDYYVGEEAFAKRVMLTLRRPVEHGQVAYWEHMEKVWHHTFFNELKVVPESHPVLITEKPLTPKANREKMAQVMFETFAVPQLFVALQETLSLYSCGKTGGMVVEMGASVTHVVPIFEGYPLSFAIQRFSLAGRDVTEYLRRRLPENGHSGVTAQESLLACELKEKYGHVALDYDAELRRVENRNEDYALSDGQWLSIPKQVMCSLPEIFFSPCMVGFSMTGLHNVIHQAITTCDVDVRPDLYANVVLSGGSASFPGLPERVAKELKDLAPLSVWIDVSAATPTRVASWVGGSIMASLQESASMFMAAAEYDELGPAYIHQKCCC